MKKCSIKKCNRDARSPGSWFCEAHYYRIRRTGAPGGPGIASYENHEHYNTPEYRAWMSLRGRCLNPKNKRFKYYGGRGLKVCRRWDIFLNFLEDVGKRPSIRHSLDRINNSKGYSPTNCQWANKTEQSRNRRGVKLSVEKATLIRKLYSSGKMNQTELSEKFNIHQANISAVILNKIWKI